METGQQLRASQKGQSLNSDIALEDQQRQQQQQAGGDINKRFAKGGQAGDFAAADMGVSSGDKTLVDEDAAAGADDAAWTREAAGELASQKPGKHQRLAQLEHEEHATKQAMYNQNRLEKEGVQTSRLGHKQFAGGHIEGDLNDEQLAGRHLHEQHDAEVREQAKEYQALPGEDKVQDQPEGHNQKREHKKLDEKQLKQHQQMMQERENVHQSQKRVSASGNPAGGSGEATGRAELGDIAHKQVAHEEVKHKKGQERESTGEIDHETKQQREHQLLKEQQGEKNLGGAQKKKIEHHKRSGKEVPRTDSASSTTSSSSSDACEHEQLDELTNTKLARDDVVGEQEALQGRQKLGGLQGSQAGGMQLPRKERQSEDEKDMSSKLGEQIPRKQEASGQQQKEGSTLKPSQKKDYESH